MNIPSFTAQASLYRTSNRYRSSGGDFGCSIAVESVVAPYIPELSPMDTVVLAYFPGPGTRHDCNDCLGGVAKALIICGGTAAISAAAVCATTGWFTFGLSCAGAAAAYGAALIGCNAAALVATGICAATTCCPKLCGVPNPFDPGSGCCDSDETCVDQNDPNSRHGCCPVGRDCGSVCCAPGEKCCGEICCPLNYYCVDNRTCSEYPGTFANTYPPTPPDNGCYFFAGGSPCGSKCCYGGLQCCGVYENGQPICKKSCVH